MQAKERVNYEELYKNMKRDYDELLEKSQNDLIKIKIREKQLNVTVFWCRTESRAFKMKKINWRKH